MACKILNLTACIIYIFALLFVLFSFEPKKMGGIFKWKKPTGDWSVGASASYNFPGEVLVHPFYISWTGTFYDDPIGNADPVWREDGSREPTDAECLARFGPTDPAMDNWLGAMDGLASEGSKLPCIVSIANATTRSQYAQRRYANYVFGAGFEWDEDAMAGGVYRAYGPRQFFKEDYGFSPKISDTANDMIPWQYNQLTPNTWATQDAIFALCQSSGFFLAMGIVFHIIAFLMGGFIWNYSKCCCDFGVCGFIFNSLVWASLSLVCYIISVVSFAGLLQQGRKQDVTDGWGIEDGQDWITWDVAEENQLQLVWSSGGGLIISGIVLSIIAISTVSYQWAKDNQSKKDEKMQEAVQDAVRRASGLNVNLR